MNIIGGGPVGLWAGKKAADAGIDVMIHEAHSKIGEPEHCTGLLSNNIDQIIEPEVILHYINGAKFFAGSSQAFLEKKKVAKVIDRVEFDKQVYEEALSSGVSVRLNHKVSWKEFKGDIVAADGAFGITRSDFGQKAGFLPAMQFDLKEKANDFVELWFEPWSDFFIWVVPRGNSVRVGTASRDLRPLKNFILKRFGRFRSRSKYAGLVITSGPVKKTYFELPEKRVFLAGDAAGQVKPTTGGGIYTGMKCAEKIAEALQEGNPSGYEKKWRAELGRELSLQRLARWIMARNPEGFVRFLEKAKFKLEVSGDMDFQMRVLPGLMAPTFSMMFETLFFPKKKKECKVIE